jgi:MOSC domain-containing protein YiiM
MKQGRVVNLHVCKERKQAMVPVQKAVAISDLGLEGDQHAVKGSPRQVLVMDVETLDSLGLAPGEIKENVTVKGVDLSSVKAGQVFFIGDKVTLEATGPCMPCSRMDAIRPGLQGELKGRRGIITMVLNGGTLKVGDAVRVEPSREALRAEAGRRRT